MYREMHGVCRAFFFYAKQMKQKMQTDMHRNDLKMTIYRDGEL